MHLEFLEKAFKPVVKKLVVYDFDWHMNVWSWTFLASLLVAGRLCALPQAEPRLALKMEPVPPFPTLRAAAEKVAIPLDGIDPFTENASLCPGNSVTALVTLRENHHRLTQWLIFFEAETVTNKDSKPPKPMVRYTSTGNTFEFQRAPARLRIRTLGPFADPASGSHRSSAKDESAEVSVNEAFLELGLNQGVAAVARWDNPSHRQDATNFMRSFGFGNKPYDSARISHDKVLAAKLGVTTEDERGLVECIPALQSYFNTVQETPGLETMMRKVASLPSLWSVLTHLGFKVEMGINFRSASVFTPKDWRFPANTPACSLLTFVEINDHDALNVTMITAPSRPPLLVCGGIIGFLAQNPDDDENYLTLRVISARRAKQAGR